LGLLDGMFESSDESLEKILVSLQNPENVSMQTEIQRPVILTQLETLADWIALEGDLDTANFIRSFVKEYRINMVSFNRQSRQEIVSAVAEGLKEQRSVGSKLASPQPTE